MREIVSLVLAASLFGCASALGPEEITRFTAARTAWDRAGLENYRFTVHYECFCAVYPHRAIVEVREGAVVSVLDASTGATPPQVVEMRTIPGILELIAHALESRADVVRVEYDAALGIPREVFLDYSRQAIDDEVRIRIQQFVALE